MVFRGIIVKIPCDHRHHKALEIIWKISGAFLFQETIYG